MLVFPFPSSITESMFKLLINFLGSLALIALLGCLLGLVGAFFGVAPGDQLVVQEGSSEEDV